jgi:hypothetical protein
MSPLALAEARLANPQFAPPKPTKEQRQAGALKQILGVSDKEWEVLAPKLENVLTLQRERERFIGKPKVPKTRKFNDASNATPSPSGLDGIVIKVDPKKDAGAGTTNAQLADSFAKLAAMASDESNRAHEMTATLREFRAAQAKSHAELAQARSELRELVTVKQEAVLVLMKVLD